MSDKQYLNGHLAGLDGTRFLCNLLVVLIHSTGVLSYVVDWRNTATCRFWMWAIDASRLAMPIFFFISGYLLFSKYELATYGRKIRSRVRRLLIPYMVWNAIYLLAFFAMSAVGRIQNPHIGSTFWEGLCWTVDNLICPIHDPGCPPMWYVRAIFIYSLLSPILFVVRNWIGSFLYVLLIIGWGVVSCLTGVEASCWTNYPFYSLLAFGLGHVAATQGWAFEIKPISRRVLAVIVGVCAVFACKYACAYGDNGYNPTGWRGVLAGISRVLQIGLAVGLATIVGKFYERVGLLQRLQKSSFVLYAVHYALLMILEPILASGVTRLNLSDGVFVTVLMILTFCLVVIVSHLIWVFGVMIAPKLMKIVDGTY